MSTPSVVAGLLAQRDETANELRTLYAGAEFRNLNDTETRTEAELQTKIAKLDADVRSATKAMERGDATAAVRSADPLLNLTNGATAVAAADEMRALADAIENGKGKVDFSTKGLESRDVLSTSFSGVLTPQELSTPVQRLYEQSPILSLATKHSDKGSGTLRIPKVTGVGTAIIVAEAAAFTESDPVVDSIVLGGYKIGTAGQYSWESEQHSPINMAQLISGSIAERIGQKVGEYLSIGTGSAQPLGIWTAAPVGVTSASPTAVTLDEVMALYFSVDAPYRKNGVWILNDATYFEMAKLKDSQGNYLMAPNGNGDGFVFMNRPVVFDPYGPTLAATKKVILFGDVSRFHVRLSDLRIESNDSVGFLNDLVTVRGAISIDSGLTDDYAVKALVTHA